MRKSTRLTLFLLRNATLAFLLAMPAWSQTGEKLMTASGFWRPAVGKALTDPVNSRYAFQVAARGNIKIEMASLLASHVYLLDGSGNILDQKDSEPNYFATIVRTLDPGNYTVVAATRDSEIGKYSSFHLALYRTDALLAITASPQILTAPSSISVTQRRTVVLRGFTGLVTGVRWYRNGTLIPGAVGNELTIISATSADAGQYAMEAVTGTGVLKSAAATVTVGAYVPSPVTWSQSGFVIGTFWDAKMYGTGTLADEAQVKKMWDAGIRHATGLNKGNSATRFSSTTSGHVANTYRLARHAAQWSQYPLPMMATDERIESSYRAYHQDQVAAAANDYKALPSNQRTAFLGYHIADEPWYRNRDPDVDFNTFGLGNELLKLEQVQAVDPERPGYINLRANWGFHSTAQYEEYVRQFALHRDTKIISFDYYVLDKVQPSGYFRVANGASFFWHHKLFANAVREARTTLGKEMSFWGYGASTEHKGYNTKTGVLDRHIISPDESQLRFIMYSPMLYGANGHIWFTFGNSGNNYFNAPDDTPALRTRMASVNYEAKYKGTLIKDMEWVATVHGSATDPYSGETGLDNVASPTGQLVFRPEHLFPAQYAVGVFKSKSGRSDNLLIMNKNITKPGTTATPGPDSWNFRVQGYPREVLISYQNTETVGTWHQLPRTVNSSDNSVSFPVDFVGPGDARLVSLKRTPVSTMLNPLNF